MYQILEVDFASPAYDECVRLRDQILRQPLGLQFTSQQLQAEYQSIHLACYDQEARLQGCLVLVPLDKGRIKMRQVAVDEAHQKKGIGTALVKASEAWAQRHGYKIMELHARKTAIPFYDRLGYSKVGKAFVEVTLPHRKMEKNMNTNLHK